MNATVTAARNAAELLDDAQDRLGVALDDGEFGDLIDELRQEVVTASNTAVQARLAMVPAIHPAVITAAEGIRDSYLELNTEPGNVRRLAAQVDGSAMQHLADAYRAVLATAGVAPEAAFRVWDLCNQNGEGTALNLDLVRDGVVAV